MNVGIVGAGSMGAAHAAGWSATNANVTGIYSQHSDRVRALAARFNAAAYDNLERLLADVDIVDICTPTDTHSRLAIRAAKAGVHILCEKPIARTLSEGQAMIEACRDNGVRIMPAHVLRFFPEYQQARQTVVDGRYGAPAVLRLYRHCFSPRVEGDNWFVDRRRSGGVILDLMLHDIDFALWTAGAARRVYAAYARREPSPAEDEHAMVMIEHVGGAISHIEGSWAFPPPTFRMGFEIALESSLLCYDSPHANPLTVYRKRRVAATDAAAGTAAAAADGGVPQPADDSPYAAEIAAFYDALTHNHPFPVDIRDALYAVRVALAAIAAADGGAVQTVSDGDSIEEEDGSV